MSRVLHRSGAIPPDVSGGRLKLPQPTAARPSTLPGGAAVACLSHGKSARAMVRRCAQQLLHRHSPASVRADLAQIILDGEPGGLTA